MSGRLVAAITITPVQASKPSSSTSSWLSVCSRSRWPSRATWARWAPRASISSRKRIAGATALASAKKVAHARGPLAHEDLDELGGGGRVEGGVCLPGHGPREQGLATARRAREQEAARGPCPHRGKALWLLEVVADLRQLVDRLVDPGHV